MKKAAPPPAPFPSQAACLEAWFDVLGPMNGSSKTDHRSGIYPIEGRLGEIRQLVATTVATRGSGVNLPFFDAIDTLGTVDSPGPASAGGLDLLDRLLLLALVRDSFEARSRGGLVLAQMCDAAGAATHTQQEAVRERLEESGSLRAHRLVESDADPDLQKRFYHVPIAARDALLRGETDYQADRLPVPEGYPAFTSVALSCAEALLQAVVTCGGGPIRWADAIPGAPGWDRIAPFRRNLYRAAQVALGRMGDPLAETLSAAEIDVTEGAAAFLLVAARSENGTGVAGSLLDLALGTETRAEGYGWLSPESPLVTSGLVVVRSDGRSRATTEGAVPGPLFRRIFPEVTPEARTERRPEPERESEEGVEKVVPRLQLAGVVLPAASRTRLDEALAVPAAVLRYASEWGLGEGLSAPPGVALLFYGPPGTGKTLAAEAVAGELGKTLWRLRTDQILSKYVGETEKAIASVFRAARASGDVVLLDEADSLLTDRSDADKRWEVSQVNLLLQEIERFPGVVILTTNRDRTLDPALERRLLARIEFAMPGEAERTALWEKHLPPRAPRAADVDLPALARDYPLSGSFIRTAAFLASVRATRRPEGERVLRQADLSEAAAEQFSRLKTEKSPMGFVVESHGRRLSHPPADLVCRRNPS